MELRAFLGRSKEKGRDVTRGHRSRGVWSAAGSSTAGTDGSQSTSRSSPSLQQQEEQEYHMPGSQDTEKICCVKWLCCWFISLKCRV